MIKKLLILFAFLLPLGASAQFIIQGPQGGTNIGTGVAGDVGKCLKVSSVGPLVWTVGTCGSGGGGGGGLSSTTPWVANDFTYVVDDGTISASSSPFFSTFNFGNATGTNATTTNFFSTTGTLTNLFFDTSSFTGSLTAKSGANLSLNNSDDSKSITIANSGGAGVNQLDFSLSGSPDLSIDNTGVVTMHNATSTLFSSTYASTSVFILSGASDGCAQFSNSGTLSSTGVACGSGSGSAYPFQGSGNSTSTLTGFTGGLFAYASSTLNNFTFNLATGTAATTTSFAISGITSALHLGASNGAVTAYAGTSCTNQFVRALSGTGSATCATVGSADVSLANLTATDSTLTFSGTYNGSTARTIGINLGTSNTWTSANTIFNNYVGIGTSTPQWALQVASSTRSQLTLSTGTAGNDHLSFRWTGSLFDIASSSNSTFATSTTPILEVNANQNRGFAIGTTTSASISTDAYLYGTATTSLQIDTDAVKGGCIVLKDSDGVGYTYVTANNGTLFSSTNSCL